MLFANTSYMIVVYDYTFHEMVYCGLHNSFTLNSFNNISLLYSTFHLHCHFQF